jgi:hypothetical protein
LRAASEPLWPSCGIRYHIDRGIDSGEADARDPQPDIVPPGLSIVSNPDPIRLLKNAPIALLARACITGAGTCRPEANAYLVITAHSWRRQSRTPIRRPEPDGVASATPDVGSVMGFFFLVVRPHEVLENAASDSFAALVMAAWGIARSGATKPAGIGSIHSVLWDSIDIRNNFWQKVRAGHQKVAQFIAVCRRSK